ncbi:hypothetical protein ABE096_13870 [Robertmurraya massiliosenegalensis]|uniref:hypothetical protein n=1 Tax=Robertmurraya TaxID=2837507 RepID=UPI0039A74F95
MANSTPNYDLTKPTPDEFYDIEIQNENMDKIDGALKTFRDEVKKEDVETATLVHGDNLITSKQKTPINVVHMQGRTEIVEGQGFRGIVNPTIEVEDTREVLDTTLHGMNDIYDEIIRENGVLKKIERFKELILDGNLVWEFSASRTGYKTVRTKNISNSIPFNVFDVVVKYDGKTFRLLADFNHSTRDQAYITGDGTFIVSISNVDSGWGQDYTPTADEFKAYFLGWKMFDQIGSRYDPYNGVAIKAWCPRYTDGTLGEETYTTLPIESHQNWQPYRLLYQLATPQRVTVPTKGMAMLEEGENAVKLRQGIVVRERVIPHVSTTMVFINRSESPTGILRHKAKKIFSVFKNDDVASEWVIEQNPLSHGEERAFAVLSDIDPTATYYVTYEILPELTAQADNVEVEYSQNIKSIVEEHTEQLKVHEDRLDGLPDFIANTSGIVESGRNANGYYVKFADGTMECYFQGVITQSITTSAGSMFTGVEQTWVYPASFKSAEDMWFGGSVNSSNLSNASYITPFGSGNTANIQYKIISPVSSGSAIARVRLRAIGRWK